MMIVLMDGRARYSIDDALIVSAGQGMTEAEAVIEAKEREDDSVVVDLDKRIVLWTQEMDDAYYKVQERTDP